MNELVDLPKHNVDYVVVGGYAVAAYGSPLVTQDVDVCCDFSPQNLMRIQSALEGQHPVHRMTAKRVPLVLTPENSKSLKNIDLDTDIGPLDCLGSVLGIGDFIAVKKRSIRVKLEGFSCRLIELDALIEAKKAMGRPRDLAAVSDLEAIKERMQND